jgi:hypothetical protein
VEDSGASAGFHTRPEEEEISLPVCQNQRNGDGLQAPDDKARG